MRVLTAIFFLSQFALGMSACSLCPDGSDVTLPEKLLLRPDPIEEPGVMLTCQVVDDRMRQLPDEECNSDGMHQNGIVGASMAYGMNIASYCGCEGVEPPSDPCQVCPTDQILINEDLSFPFEIGTQTCSMFYEIAKHSPAEDQHWCKDRLIVNQQFSFFCCGVSKSPCSLCPDGLNPTLPEKLLASIPLTSDSLLTCQAIDDTLKQLPYDHCNSQIMKYNSIVPASMAVGMNIASYCGCEGVEPPSDPCQVCAKDQVVINGDTIIPDEMGNPEQGAFTCSLWYDIAKHSTAEDQIWCKDMLIVDPNSTLYTDLCCGVNTTGAPTAAPVLALTSAPTSAPTTASGVAGKVMFSWMLMALLVAKALSY